MFENPQEPLYRLEATGLELSDDVLQTRAYLKWFVSMNYEHRGSWFQ